MFACREQVDREQALEDFKTGQARILIATDVASRGLDIRGVTLVICLLCCERSGRGEGMRIGDVKFSGDGCGC